MYEEGGLMFTGYNHGVYMPVGRGGVFLCAGHSMAFVGLRFDGVGCSLSRGMINLNA